MCPVQYSELWPQRSKHRHGSVCRGKNRLIQTPRGVHVKHSVENARREAGKDPLEKAAGDLPRLGSEGRRLWASRDGRAPDGEESLWEAWAGRSGSMREGSELGKEGQAEATGQLGVRPDQAGVHLANPTHILASMHRGPP